MRGRSAECCSRVGQLLLDLQMGGGMLAMLSSQPSHGLRSPLACRATAVGHTAAEWPLAAATHCGDIHEVPPPNQLAERAHDVDVLADNALRAVEVAVLHHKPPHVLQGVDLQDRANATSARAGKRPQHLQAQPQHAWCRQPS